jgi:GTP-binding protein HflX
VNEVLGQRVVLVGLADDGLDELAELVRAAGAEPVARWVQRRDAADPDRYLGRGSITQLGEYAQAASAGLIVTDDELTPRQGRNLETALDLPVLDRTAIILDIFAARAQSAEGKLQVELAQLHYSLARMRGLWTHLERLGGGIGTRGPGETQIETDRRLARQRIAHLERQLERVRTTRSTMRSRRERAGLTEIALVGYTNAGKSSLLNAIAGTDLGAAARPFHTLDPATRRVVISGRDHLFTDTVGFIRKLPHQLVDAFSATLEETLRAQLLLVIADAAQASAEQRQQAEAVEAVLQQLGSQAQRILVLNKSDLLDSQTKTRLACRYPDAVLVSALTGEGIAALLARVEHQFQLPRIHLCLPYDAGHLIADIYRLGADIEREDREDGIYLSARLPIAEIARLAEFLV